MIVLDTHTIVWDALATSKLSQTARAKIEEADREGTLIICDISLWEIAMLVKKERIQVDETPANLIKTILDSRSYSVRRISPEIAALSVDLAEDINNDPADRLIVATSILENFPLVTADKNLRRAKSVETIW